MKKVLHVVTTSLIVVFVSLLSTSCSEGQSQTINHSNSNESKLKRTNSVAVFTLLDVTASAKNKQNGMNLTTEQLNRLFDLESDPKKSIAYYQSILSEVHLNQVFFAKLPSAKEHGYNKFKRANEIKKFNSALTSALENLKNLEYGRKTSSIFIPVAETINKLASTGADKQVLLLNTDLFENTFIMSKYDKKQMTEIENNPQILSTILDKETPINQKLDKMTIYIIHQPTSDTDEDFYIISRLYSKWLESKGAKVIITANITF